MHALTLTLTCQSGPPPLRAPVVSSVSPSPILVLALFCFSLLCIIAPPRAASAGEGIYEINQTCAVVTGCLPGDAPGFPVTLDVSGSYRLTSDLVPAGADGIALAAPSISLDLSGFSIRGPGSCSGSSGTNLSCSGNAGTGVSVPLGLGFGVTARIRGGTVSGFADGLSLAFTQMAVVEDMIVRECSGNGIGFNSGRIANVVVRRNGGIGISFLSLLGDFVLRDSDVSQNGLDGVRAPGTIGIMRGNVFAQNGGWGLFSEILSGIPANQPAYAENSFSQNGGGSARGGSQVGGNLCSPACP